MVNIKVWRNGALGSMSVTMCTYPNNYEGSITILGEKGTVRIGGVAVNDIQEWTFSEPKDYDARRSNRQIMKRHLFMALAILLTSRMLRMYYAAMQNQKQMAVKD